MDYKFIEQLLNRYFEAETTADEERVLRECMKLQDLPAHIARYRDLFLYEERESQLEPSADFERRLLEAAGITEEKPTITVRARRRSIANSLRPFYQAAAAVAVVALVGIGAGRSFNAMESEASGEDAEQVAASETPAAVTIDLPTAAVDTLFENEARHNR